MLTIQTHCIQLSCVPVSRTLSTPRARAVGDIHLDAALPRASALLAVKWRRIDDKVDTLPPEFPICAQSNVHDCRHPPWRTILIRDRGEILIYASQFPGRPCGHQVRCEETPTAVRSRSYE